MNHTIPPFHKTNLQNIKNAFEEKTGVELSAHKPIHRPIRTVIVLVAVLICSLSLTAFAISSFSSLSGDDLTLDATYDGNGIVSVLVENKSDKELHFQSTLKLMLWSSGEEIQSNSDSITFNGTKIPAHSSGTMTIDLSKAYDLEQLEVPLTDDSYYMILTNNNFVFGQDWICTVQFSEPVQTSVEQVPSAHTEEATVQQINDGLRFYFETFPDDPTERTALEEEYVQTYANLFSEFDGHIVPSVSPSLYIDTTEPVVFDSTVSSEEQGTLWGEYEHSCDMNGKLLATASESAITISAMLPLTSYDDSYADVPLFYIFTYEKSSIASENDCAFIFGQIKSFSDLAEYKVYEDEQYVCYEVSALIYSDVNEHIQNYLSQNTNVCYDSQIKTRVETIYSYFKNNLCNMFIYF